MKLPKNTRKFGGKLFKLWYSNVLLTDVPQGKKKWADQHASRLQKLGYDTKIIKLKNGYAVYKGIKKRKKK